MNMHTDKARRRVPEGQSERQRRASVLWGMLRWPCGRSHPLRTYDSTTATRFCPHLIKMVCGQIFVAVTDFCPHQVALAADKELSPSNINKIATVLGADRFLSPSVSAT
jgi:hypothetical protein